MYFNFLPIIPPLELVQVLDFTISHEPGGDQAPTSTPSDLGSRGKDMPVNATKGYVSQDPPNVQTR